MTARFGATLEGGDDLLRDLNQMGSLTKKSLKGVTKAGADVIAAAANARAATITSRSGKHVRVRVRVRPGGYAVGAIFPAKGKAHLKLHEYGTKAGWRWARKNGPFKFYAGNRLVVTRLIKHPGMAKRPWLAPAFNAAKDEAAQAYGRALRKVIEDRQALPEGAD